jgi:hypothetical protein
VVGAKRVLMFPMLTPMRWFLCSLLVLSGHDSQAADQQWGRVFAHKRLQCMAAALLYETLWAEFLFVGVFEEQG